MTPPLAHTILDILSFSRPGHAWEEQIRRADARVWEHTLRWLDQSGLAIYFWRQVREAGIQDVLPPQVCAALDRRRLENAVRTSAIVEEWKQIEALVDSAQVPFVTLKGVALVPDYCPDPFLRLQFDHDFLLGRSSLPAVEKVLACGGYLRRGRDAAGQMVYIARASSLNGSREPCDFYSVRLPRPVELHLDLWQSDREGVPLMLPGDFLARSTTRTWEGTAFRALSDEDALLFEVLHAFRHIVHNWCRLSALYEISYFLNRRRFDGNFWHQFCARIETNLLLRRITGVVFNLSSSLFKVSDPLTSVPGRFFPLTAQLQLWIDLYGKGSALDNFSGNKFSLFLLREFVPDRAKWSEIRRRRLFPLQLPHRQRIPALKRAYPSLGDACRYGSRVARRFWYHARTAAQYPLERLRWYFLTRLYFGGTANSGEETNGRNKEKTETCPSIQKESSLKRLSPTRASGAS